MVEIHLSQIGRRCPNWKWLNRYNLGVHCTIVLKFGSLVQYGRRD